VKLDVLGVQRRPHGVDGGLDHSRDVDRREVKAHVTGDDPRHVQQVVDEAGLCDGVPLDDGERVLAPRR
jgi:hypothetical protein